MTQGGPIIPVAVSSDAPTGEPALRVTGSAAVDMPRGVAGGPAQPVYIVSDAQVAAGYPVQANAPVPMILARDGRPVAGQRPIPVYVVSGTLYTYQQRLAATAPANLIAYWPLNETSGTVAVDASGNGRNGAYSGVTLGAPGIGDGNTAASFDGANDFVNIYGASLAATFNAPEGTLAGWARVSGAGVWTDATTRRIALVRVDNSNRVTILRNVTNNTLELRYDAGGTLKAVTIGGQSSTGWFHIAITWSKVADQMKAYLNGAQSGSTQTGLGTWAGALNAATTLLGAGNSSTGAEPWSGFQAHWALWSTPLTAAQIAALATV